VGQDYRQAPLASRDAAMLDYVVKLTRTPWSVAELDVAAVRTAGFTDAAILDIVLVAGYYAFVNRLAQGLGVPLEAFWDEELKNESDDAARHEE